MDTLLLNGNRYMKASSAARETGYTMDYIGQLCRKKKMDSQLVGRTWYVRESEITEHRRTRGRSSATKVREAVRKAVIETGHARPSAQPEYRRRLLAHSVKYHSDDSELLPQLESRHLDIKSSDRETTITPKSETGVIVTSEEDHESTLHAVRSDHSDIKWNGTIVVSALDEPQESVEDDKSEKEAHIKPKITDGGRSVAVRVAKRTEEIPEAELPQAEMASEEAPQSRKEVPAFIDRLNHAHILNGQLEESTENEGGLTLPEQRPLTPRTVSSVAGFATTLLIGMVSIMLVFSNLLIEKVVYVDHDESEQGAYRIMSLRYDFVSVDTIADKGATALLALRNIYDLQDSSPD